jgi:hypothetical protein
MERIRFSVIYFLLGVSFIVNLIVEESIPSLIPPKTIPANEIQWDPYLI